MEHSSGEKETRGRITIRKHRQLRSDLIECVWTAKRTDPALALYYTGQVKKGKNGKAAIVKVAGKLVSRIRLYGGPISTINVRWSNKFV